MNPTYSEPPDVLNDFPPDFDLKRRKYLHFDFPISTRRARALVLSPAQVATHPFLPFLKRVLRTPKYRKSKGKVINKTRKVAFASHADAAIYQYYSYMLSREYESFLLNSNLSDIPIAYRKFEPSKCNINFAHEAFSFITSHLPAVVIACDVTGFFDNLNHDLLKSSWCKVLDVGRLPADHYRVFRSVTGYAFALEIEVTRALGIKKKGAAKPQYRLCTSIEFRDKIRSNRLVHTNHSGHGIPQGSPISGLLSNVYMIPFDTEVSQYVNDRGGYFRRYSDDILIVLPLTSEDDPDEVKSNAIAMLNETIAKLSLVLKAEKTEKYICVIGDDGRFTKDIQYLGLCFDGKNVRIRHQTLGRYYGRLSRYLKRSHRAAQQNPTRQVIFRRKLHQKYTHFGSRNFIGYAYRCVRICDEPAIKRQVSNHMRVIQKRIKSFTKVPTLGIQSNPASPTLPTKYGEQ